MEKTFKYSKSEKRGLKHLNKYMTNILSIGISTGGSAEISMAKKCPNAHIIATTVDEKGLTFSKEKIEEIETKVKRQFLFEKQLKEVLTSHNFKILSTKSYKKWVYTDYERTRNNRSKKPNFLTEVVVTKGECYLWK